MEGVGVYSFDSSICRAAIHMGILFPGKGGVVNVTLGFPMLMVYGVTSHEVMSMDGEKAFKTFKVSETDSCSMWMSEHMED